MDALPLTLSFKTLPELGDFLRYHGESLFYTSVLG
jgi:hypothetical protein